MAGALARFTTPLFVFTLDFAVVDVLVDAISSAAAAHRPE